MEQAKCPQKIAKANNRHMGELNGENKPSSYINYLDANHLYGMATSQNLPLKNLKWMDKMPAEKEILNYDDGSKGYIVEVDLEYPTSRTPRFTHRIH